MRDLDDAELVSLIKVTLRSEAQVADVGRHITASDLMTARHQRQAARIRRRPYRLLALAAALLVPVGLVVSGRIDGPSAPTGDVAILGRQADGGKQMAMVAVARDGRERALTVFSPPIGPGRMLQFGVADRSGALALRNAGEGGDGLLLLDLAHPDRAPVRIDAPDVTAEELSFAWGPRERFAAAAPDGTVLVVEPRTGERRRHEPLTDGGWNELAWAADGSGLVALEAGSALLGRFAETGAMTIEPGSDIPLHPRPWGRTQGSGGDHLPRCASGLTAACHVQFQEGILRVAAGSESRVVFRVERPSDRLRGASFAVDGALWVLLHRVEEDAYALLHVAADGATTEVSRGPMAAGSDNLALHGITPDDTLVVVLSGREVSETILVPTDGAPPTRHEGVFMGFAPAEAASQWPGGTWSDAQGPEIRGPSAGAGP